MTAPEAERPRLMEDVVRPRFRELTTLARTHGRDWGARHVLPDVDERWYLTY